MKYAQIYDLVEPAAAGSLDTSGLCGEWINSNPQSTGIARMTLTESDGKFSLQAFGMGDEGLIDWGNAPIEPVAFGPTSRVAGGISCEFSFDFKRVRLQGMIMKGLLVLTEFHTFTDDSHRMNYFLREYYGLAHGQY
jgi:hypothetical protein